MNQTKYTNFERENCFAQEYRKKCNKNKFTKCNINVKKNLFSTINKGNDYLSHKTIIKLHY